MDCEYLALGQGRTIAYRKSRGASPGVVFLGGFRSDMEGTKAVYLEKVFASRNRSFLRFDYCGHGRSSGRFEDGCIGEWAEEAAETITSVTDGPQILVGSSMGGWVALLLSKWIPSKISGLVGIASAPDFTETFERNLTESQREQLTETGRIEMPSEYSDEPLVFTRKLIEDGNRNLVLKDPLNLPFPSRFLQGSEDEDVEPSVAIRLFEHVEGPDVRLTMVKGADHRFSNDDCLSLIVREIDSVLSA